MKTTFQLTGKTLLTSLLLVGGVTNIVNAASGQDATYKNITLEERLYLFDGYGSKWGFDAGNDGLWLVPERPIGDTYNAPFKIRNAAEANTLVIGGDNNTTHAGYVGIGTDTPESKLDIQFTGDAPTNTDPVLKGLMVLTSLASNNTNTAKTSDVAFALKNARENFKWNFRTFAPGEGFLATKEGSGGGEFRIDNPTNDFRNTKMVVAGVTVFENGHLVTASSRELKTDIKPLDPKAAMDAFHKLQPVSYEYKAQKGEPVVGFIAEDVPDLVAMPSRKSFDSAEVVAVLTKVVQEQEKKIKELKAMQTRLEKVELLLNNLTLETSK